VYSFVDTAFRALRVLVLPAGFSILVLTFVDVATHENAAETLAAYLVGGGTLLVALWAWSDGRED
jgi:hypothetical protein